MRAIMHSPYEPLLTVQEATPDGWAECWIECNGRLVWVEVLPPPGDPETIHGGAADRLRLLARAHDDILRRC